MKESRERFNFILGLGMCVLGWLVLLLYCLFVFPSSCWVRSGLLQALMVEKKVEDIKSGVLKSGA